VVYDGKLATGWIDWGWGPHDLPRSGPAKVVFGGYGGIIFHHASLDANFGFLSFRYKAPGAWPQFLIASLKGSGTEGAGLPTVRVDERNVVELPDGWHEAWIPLSELNPKRLPFESIVLAARSQVTSDWVLVDEVFLSVPNGVDVSAPGRDVRLAISCDAPTHRINPLIYGSAQGDWESGQTAQRLGGNPTTRFNWDLGVWNAANDWFFENGKSIDLTEFLEDGLRHDAASAVTVPMIGWVAKDEHSVGFPRAQFPSQRKFDPNRPDVGDGHRSDGSMLRPGSPTQTSIPAAPELIGRWVGRVHDKDQARGKRGVKMYILDNEPSLWDTTHADVHPEPLGYDELLDRTVAYATAVRKADPDALIAGPAEWGWLGYLYSARDRAAGQLSRPDRRAHGDTPLIPWYLTQIAQKESRAGVRLLDVLDVHFYPAADGIYGGNARTDADGSALRLRSTRALWDPDYKDESWIDEPIHLIPRLKEWVASYHPGLLISIGEWSFGADGDISGGLASAEALGRFGQQGLDAAFYWGGPKLGTATFWAFRAFRNFDGKGSRFWDVSLPTVESPDVSLFASRSDSNNELVAIAINKSAAVAAAVHIALNACGLPASQRQFRYAAGYAGLKEEKGSEIEEGGKSIKATLPPYSLTVFDLRWDPASGKP
jgi:hypothetical protein